MLNLTIQLMFFVAGALGVLGLLLALFFAAETYSPSSKHKD